MFGRDHEVILGVLAHRGVASSQQLQEATGKSQATVSRLLADLSGQVLAFGRARATRYALPRPIRGLAGQQPIWWTDADGSYAAIGIFGPTSPSALRPSARRISGRCSSA